MKQSPMDERCLSCKFIGYGTARNKSYLPGRICNYLLITGRHRGCPVGKACDKYEKKED